MSKLRWLEIFAVASGMAYTLFITYGIIWCWLFAFISSALFLYICFQKRIYAESLLQMFYILTAVYGYLNWGETGGEIRNMLTWEVHGMIILSGGSLVLVSGLLLRRLTDAATPFVDSFTTVFSVFGTLLMINLYPENWYYWIVIDAVSIWLYLNRGLYITAGLFFIYVLMAINGAMEWMS